MLLGFLYAIGNFLGASLKYFEVKAMKMNATQTISYAAKKTKLGRYDISMFTDILCKRNLAGLTIPPHWYMVLRGHG